MDRGRVAPARMRLTAAGIAAGLALVTSTAAQAQGGASLDYDLVANGSVNGAMHVEVQPGGSVSIRNRYQSQDKVRELAVSYTADSRGLPRAMRRVGQAFAFQPIDERFNATGRHAEWRNRVETASSDHAEGRYYVPLGLSTSNGPSPGDAAAYEYGLLASAVLRAPGHTLDLLPVGRARAEVLTSLTVHQGRRSERVRLVAVTGLGIEPDYVWLDDANRLFTGHKAIRSGWRAQASLLDGAQRSADQRALKQAIAQLAVETRPAPILIENVSVFDPATEQLLPHRDVLIDGGRVDQVYTRGAGEPTLSPAVRRVPGEGKTLLPGLWDMHVHLSGAREALRHLSAGVTTVRDMGNNNAALAELVGRIEAGEIPGPHVIRAGFIEGTGPSTTYQGRLVSSEAEALAAVDAYAKAGFPQIKLYNQVRPEWVHAIALRAHAQGLRLSGHIPFGDTATRAIEDGYDEIQHFVFLFLNFAPQPVTTGLTFTTARVAQTLQFDSPQFQALVDLMLRHHTVMDMTLSVYEPVFIGEPGRPAPMFAAYADALPPAMLRQTALGPLPTPSGMTTAQFQSTFGKALNLAKLLYDDKIQLIAGTDSATLGGLALPRELELMVKAGIPAPEVLRIATLDAARVMHMDDHYGSVTPGKAADLILVSGDPTRNISDLRKLDLVIKGGVAYQPLALLTASGVPAERR